MAKKSAARAGAKKSNRKPKRTWSVYVHRSLKQVNKSLSLSGKSMKIFNSFVNDMFDRIATQAAQVARASKKSTLGAREVATAVRLVLPSELAKHASGEGVKAVSAASA